MKPPAPRTLSCGKGRAEEEADPGSRRALHTGQQPPPCHLPRTALGRQLLALAPPFLLLVLLSRSAAFRTFR